MNPLITGPFDLNSLPDADFPFVIFRLPGQVCFSVMIGKLNLFTPKKMMNNQGFVLAPFIKSAKNPFLFLQADYILQDLTEIPATFFLKMNSWKKESGSERIADTNKQTYLQNLEEIIQILQSGIAQKVVVSRTTSVNLLSIQQLSQFYIALCKAYPSAFVYLANLPSYGIWMGASPETLISGNGNNFKTMALAGTRPAGATGDWGLKEQEEQAIVTRYILEIINRQKVKNLMISNPFSLRAGKIEHLCTTFNFTIDGLNGLSSLAQQLHPTPAVCGIPTDIAKHLISRFETHDRGYYTGFLGPVNFNKKTELFVNLRCLKITPQKMILFTGSGITKDSVPENEWEETELKTHTLMDVIEKIRNQ